jgi:hypothetical protein
MNRLKKLLVVLLVLLVLSQVPFAYRRYKLYRLRSNIDHINQSRRNVAPPAGYAEYKGVLHVHSSLGGHSRGSLADIVSAARANQLDFVVMTEHTEAEIDTAELTLKGTQDGVLFVNGNEVSTGNGDRLLVLPGEKSLADAGRQSTAEVVSGNRSRGAISLVAYPSDFKSWQLNELDGIEVYNTFTNAKRIKALPTFFDVLWSQRSYPDLMFANFYERPDDALKLWDQALQQRKISGVAGNDAHANIGVSLDDKTGQSITGVKLDPYEVSFRLVRVHVLLPKEVALSRESLLAAIKAGHCFIGFDVFGDSTGFSFTADKLGEMELQGSEVRLTEGLGLRIQSPVTARVRLLKNGVLFQEAFDVGTMRTPITAPGVYRVEAYLPQLGATGAQPWVISNPIYVR